MSNDSSKSDFFSSSLSSTESRSGQWQPLTSYQRRVLGVLIEKSKTTPDVYPMSINGVKTGCNQKSNRSPKMDLQEEQVENVLHELRKLGCVIEVHSGGRVPKYKHQAYDWLAVQKAELGVLAELLLRGEQTVGELRARAARMENEIQGLDDLAPILANLLEKDLIIELTPPGRGQIVTHNLYSQTEKERLLDRFKEIKPFDDPNGYTAVDDETDAPLANWGGDGQSKSGTSVPTAGQRPSEEFNWKERIESLERQVEHLQHQLSDLKAAIEN